jgi:hypothetical protein
MNQRRGADGSLNFRIATAARGREAEAGQSQSQRRGEEPSHSPHPV